MGNIRLARRGSSRKNTGSAWGLVATRLLVAGLLVTPACGPDTPLGPLHNGAITTPPALTAAEADQASEALEAGLFRLLPGVGDSAATRELQAALAGLRAGLTVAAPQELAAGVSSARAVLDRLRRDTPLANAPDLDAIGLILDGLATPPRASGTSAVRQQTP